jgi:hypothetical protein
MTPAHNIRDVARRAGWRRLARETAALVLMMAAMAAVVWGVLGAIVEQVGP